MNFRMVRGDGVANLLENSGFARARRSDDQTAGTFANGRHQINHPGLNQVRGRFQLEFLDGVNAGQVLKADCLGIFLKGHFIDPVHGLELWARAAMWRLGGPLDKAAFPQEAAPDGIGRYKNVGRLGMKVILRRAQEPEALLGYLKIAGTVVGLVAIILRLTHILLLSRAETLPKNSWKSECWKIAA